MRKVPASAPSTTVHIALYVLCSLCSGLVIYAVLLSLRLLLLFCSSMSVAPILNGSPLFSIFVIASSSQTRSGLVSPALLTAALYCFRFMANLGNSDRCRKYASPTINTPLEAN